MTADRTLVPIIIGITGKRDLLGNDDAVRKVLHSCFDLLDQELPASRKLLLSGLAAGADTIAVELAQDRGWKVIAALPFELDVFAEDFDARSAEKLRGFVDPIKGSLVDPAKGRIIILKPLRDPETKKPFEPGALSRREGNSNPDRTDHYEQAGLFIAELSTLLVSVMPAGERPGRVGGTARVVEYRLRGVFDPTTERIVEHSEILRKPVELDSPQTGPVWLIDLDTTNTSTDEPMDSVQLWRCGPEKPGAPAAVERLGFTREEDLIGSLVLARRIEAFNGLASKIDDEQWQSEIQARARPDIGDAAAALKQIRHALSVIQREKKRTLTRMITALAILFVAAVLFIEMHLQFERLPPLVMYVALLFLILTVFGIARLRMSQQYSEDYRAVAEALRVQLAWWDAALVAREHRVDRIYLCGTAGSLALVRAAARHLIDAALLEKPNPQPSPADVDRWISGQINFFEARTTERRALLSRFEDIIWFLFIGSVGLAISLLPLTMALHTGDPIWIDNQLGVLRPSIFSWLAPWMAAIAVLALFGMARLLSHQSRSRRYGPQRWLIEGLNFSIGLMAGILFAICVYAFALPPYDLASKLALLGMNRGAGCAPLDFACAHSVGHSLIAGLTILVAAIAGAVRFYAERLALEAELHSYREALATFKRAQKEMNRFRGDTSEEARVRRERILLELGQDALKENESWIRAHRQRPLEPHL